MQKAKWLSKEALQIAEKRRETKGKGEKERYTHLNAEFQRIARRDKKAFPSDQCKEIEENNRMGKTSDLFKKIRDTKGTFHAKMSTIKDRNGMDLTEVKDIKKMCQEYTEELYKKAKWLSEEALQVAVKRREVKRKGEKERYTHLKTEFQIARRDKKAFLRDQCKEIEENNRMGKTRDLFKKIRVQFSSVQVSLVTQRVKRLPAMQETWV